MLPTLREILARAQEPTGPWEIMIPGIGPVTTSLAAPLSRTYQQLLKSEPRQVFWLNQSAWPRDVFGRTFLARAVDRVGKAMFEEWTGFEPSVSTTLAQIARGRDRAALEEACSLLDMVIEHGNYGPKLPELSQEQWHLAQYRRGEALDAIAPVRKRLEAVRSRLLEAFLEGSLRASMLDLRGGPFDAPRRPLTDWNVPDRTVQQRFYYCQMNPDLPLQGGFAGEGYKWIFVDADDLDNLVNMLAARPARRGPKVHPDDQAIERMLTMLDGGTSSSAWNAAGQVAENWPGASIQSTRRRLFKKFRAQHPARVRGRVFGQ
jgi:hypothetical protein